MEMNKIIDYYGKAELRNFSELLGISQSELTQLSYKIKFSDDEIPSTVTFSFSDKCPENILKKIKNLDDSNSIVFLESILDENFEYQTEIEAITAAKNIGQKFYSEIASIEELNYLFIEERKLEKIYKRQLFVSVIALMESYLSETFISSISTNKRYLKNFVSTYPKFKEQKLTFSEIYINYDNINNIAIKEASDVLYHRLHVVKNMFTLTFEIAFPAINVINKFVTIRHDLVHRNGKTNKGEEIKIGRQDVEDLITEMTVFITEIEDAINSGSVNSD